MKHDLRNLDFNLLKAFDALFDERSVTEAAKKLYLTQPAVSGMLQRLRDYFDDPLFIRAQRGIYPTSRAKQLAPTVKNILFDIDTLIQPNHFDPKNDEYLLRISATDYALKVVLVPFIAQLRIHAPHVKVSILPIRNEDIFMQLEQGTIDLALVTSDLNHKEVYKQDLFTDHYTCLIHKEHPLASHKNITLDEFCKLKYVLISHEGGNFEGITDQQLKIFNKKRDVIISINSFLILSEILANTDLVAVVPSKLANTLTDFLTFKPPIAIPNFNKSLVWHERNHRDPAQQWLRDLMVQTVLSKNS